VVVDVRIDVLLQVDEAVDGVVEDEFVGERSLQIALGKRQNLAEVFPGYA